MLKFFSLVSFASAALVESGYPYKTNQAASAFTFKWVKTSPIKTIEWYSAFKKIKYLKVTWADGSTESIGTDKTGGYMKNSVEGNDCFDFF